ncbi:MAG: S49 family peptidase [Candidatus Omnitrophota bacterium]|nr:S49 family peptidase [Candidatus Omnitrophota bacterium]
MPSMLDKSPFACLAPRIFNQPLLINPAYIPALAGRFTVQPSQDAMAKMSSVQMDFQMAQEKGPQLQVSDGIAIISIVDLLVSHTDFWSWYFGLTSYDDIRAQYQAALADPAVKNIVFRMATPGGEAAGCFDLVDEIYQTRGQKPTYAVYDDYAYSAGFAIASAVDKRYVSRTGSTGSVGVVAMHVDQSGWDSQMGLTYTYIFSGAHKIDYSPHAPLAPGVKAALQEDIDASREIFVQAVARNLGMTPAAVRATEAGIYMGKKAVDAGFADSVMSWNQFMTKLSSRKYGGIMKAQLEVMFNSFRDTLLAAIGKDPQAASQEVVTKADADKLVAAAETLAKQEGHAEGRQEGLDAGKKEGMETGGAEAHGRAVQIGEICALAGMPLATALAYIKDAALTVDAVQARVTEALAAKAEATRIRSTVGALSTGGPNALVEDARKRAAANMRVVK